MELSRRSFLRGTAVAASIASIPSLSATKNANSQESPAVEKSSVPEWLGEEPSITDADVSQTLAADVVVVGLSNAGTTAVRAAVEEGASVIVIEKSDQLMTAGGQISLFNGSLVDKLGRKPVDTAEVVAQVQAECGYRNKAAIMERFTNEVGDTFDWILEADPEAYVTETCFPELTEEQALHALIPERHPDPDPDPDPDWDYHDDTIPTFPGTFTINNLTNLCQLNYEMAQAEGNVQALFGHFAEKCIMENGRCVGVYVRNAADGTYLRVNANKGVVLATGDYSSNPKMLKAFLPALLEHGFQMLWLKKDVEGNPTNTGDGHRMAVWAGAKMQDYHCPSMHHMGGGAGADGRGVMGINGYLNLNLHGKRFMNEDVPGQQVENQVELQPKMTTYQFFDSKWPEQCHLFPAAHGVVCYYSEQDKTSYINHRSLADIQAAVEDGRAISADSIEGLLEQIEDMDVDTAKASIERYNEMCHKGVDEDFHKMARRLLPLETPPFYAVKFQPCLVVTVHGGPSSDENCHTFDADGNVIPGLYVTGNTMGDRYALQKPISVCGLSVGLSLFYGAVAGRNAANGV